MKEKPDNIPDIFAAAKKHKKKTDRSDWWRNKAIDLIAAIAAVAAAAFSILTYFSK